MWPGFAPGAPPASASAPRDRAKVGRAVTEPRCTKKARWIGLAGPIGQCPRSLRGRALRQGHPSCLRPWASSEWLVFPASRCGLIAVSRYDSSAAVFTYIAHISPDCGLKVSVFAQRTTPYCVSRVGHLSGLRFPAPPLGSQAAGIICPKDERSQPSTMIVHAGRVHSRLPPEFPGPKRHSRVDKVDLHA